MDDLADHPLEYDGHVVEMVVYPLDEYPDGTPASHANVYRICDEPCSAEKAHWAHLGLIDHAGAFLIPRVPGEFKGWDGERPVHVRARFDASCYKGTRVCIHVFYYFYEV